MADPTSDRATRIERNATRLARIEGKLDAVIMQAQAHEAHDSERFKRIDRLLETADDWKRSIIPPLLVGAALIAAQHFFK